MHNGTARTVIRNGCLLVLLSIVALPLSRSAEAQSFDLSGFVKSSYYYDTRQVVAARNAEYLLWPANESLNEGGEDTNDVSNLSSYQIFSRLGLSIGELPQVMGGNVTGYIETDFFGPTGDETNTLRIRRAFAKMAWEDREVLFGVEWSPMFTLAAFPHTVASEAGTPFNPFARQPMIKLTLKPGNLRVIGAAAWQFDAFQSDGFQGTSGIDQQQQSALPGWHGHLQYVSENATLGVGGFAKSLRPVRTGDRIFTGAVLGYFTVTGSSVIVRGKGVYGGDLHDHVKTGGIVYDPAEDADGEFVADAFQALDSFSAWVELEGTGGVAPGIMAGYLTNLGAADEVSDGAVANGRGNNIETLWEVAPRLALNHGPLRFALEVQVTNATFAEDFDANYAPSGNTTSVTNVRGDFSVFLFF